MIIIICDQNCCTVKDGWWGWKTEIFATLKFIPVIPLTRFKRSFFGLYFFLYVPK